MPSTTRSPTERGARSRCPTTPTTRSAIDSGTCSARPTAPRAGSTTRSRPIRRPSTHAGTIGSRARRPSTGSARLTTARACSTTAIRHFDVALREVGIPAPASLARTISSTSGGRPCISTFVPSGFRITGQAGRTATGGSRSRSRLTIGSARSTGSARLFNYTHCSYKIAAFAKQIEEARTGRRGLFQARPQLRHVLARMGSPRGFRSVAPRRRRHRAGGPTCGQWPGRMSAATITSAGGSTQAEADLREAVGTLDKVGDWFGMFTHHFLRHIYAVRGDIPRELAEAEAEIAHRHGARRRGGAGLGALWQGRRPRPGRPGRRGAGTRHPRRRDR